MHATCRPSARTACSATHGRWLPPVFTGLPEGAVLSKGAGVGDDPDQGAIYVFRVMEAGTRHATTGFRLVRELSDDG